jgi:hypothetical protein
MKSPRLLLAYLSLFVLALIWNGLLHLVLLADLDATVRHLYRPDLAEHMARPLVLTAGVVGVFLWGHVRFVPTRSVREGALYGAYFAVVAGLLVDLNQYILYPIPGYVAAAWFFGGLAEFTIYGVVLSRLVPARPRHAATSEERRAAPRD